MELMNWAGILALVYCFGIMLREGQAARRRKNTTRRLYKLTNTK